MDKSFFLQKLRKMQKKLRKTSEKIRITKYHTTSFFLDTYTKSEELWVE